MSFYTGGSSDEVLFGIVTLLSGYTCVVVLSVALFGAVSLFTIVPLLVTLPYVAFPSVAFYVAF